MNDKPGKKKSIRGIDCSYFLHSVRWKSSNPQDLKAIGTNTTQFMYLYQRKIIPHSSECLWAFCEQLWLLLLRSALLRTAPVCGGVGSPNLCTKSTRYYRLQPDLVDSYSAFTHANQPLRTAGLLDPKIPDPPTWLRLNHSSRDLQVQPFGVSSWGRVEQIHHDCFAACLMLEQLCPESSS